jgi:hypothetical protein
MEQKNATRKYNVQSTLAWGDLGTYEGENEAAALDALARKAGCMDYETALSSQPRTELHIKIQKRSWVKVIPV